MYLETRAADFRKLLATNDTSTSFPTKSPTLTEPTGVNVLDTRRGGALGPNAMVLIPFGAGSDGDTFDLRVLAWRYVGTGASRIWIPMIIAQFNCTLSGAVGVAGGEVINTDRFVDTMALVTNFGNANVAIETLSPQNDTPAHSVIDLKGATKIEVVFDSTGATNANCLIALL